MAVSSTLPVISYTANGSTTIFSYPFLILNAGDLKVYFDSIEVPTGFSVSGVGSSVGGDVTFDTAPGNGVVVKLLRRMILERTTDYIEGGALRANVLDSDFDRAVMMLQDTRADAASIVEFEALNGLIESNIQLVQDKADEAEASATAAAASASAASGSASSASSSASTATTQAGVATTQAGIATTQAGAAASSASSASTSASTAMTQAGIATAAAGTASSAATGASSAQSAAIAAAEDAEDCATAAAASAADAENRVPKTSDTGSAVMPTGTSAQRDAVPGHGYTRFNTTLRTLETYDDVAMAWVPAGQGATGPVGNPVFYENDQTVTGDYTLPGNKNAMSTGPITIADGATVTISDGATWVIV